jgi:mannose-6-phosphate isomerase-like protein (cupin superfamily)
MSQKVTLSEKLAQFSDYFSPRTVAEFNGHDIMVTKLSGPFIWHKHDDTDDFFLVLKGTLDIELPDKTITLGPGRCTLYPRG